MTMYTTQGDIKKAKMLAQKKIQLLLKKQRSNAIVEKILYQAKSQFKLISMPNPNVQKEFEIRNKRRKVMGL
ncbi:hypothetical protein Glove_180g81 [Diversispora epigaea]|uniref:Uncharacterized protein n=1 Tax=Diversispora epigaea TaxID=1348612 RepID=A0A397IRC0_9GLOM|nr:hypothetical protein Glove_180g81 [Diversispora epigaea]